MKNHTSILSGSHVVLFIVLFSFLTGFLVSGCALVKPSRQFDESTPIDNGLDGASAHELTIVPFVSKDVKWGYYAATRMQEYLLEERAFSRIVLAEEGFSATRYSLHGELEHLFYGGSNSPTEVCLSVSILDTTSGETRFFRKTSASSKKSAFHMTWLTRVYVPSPYPEEVVNSVLRKIAKDIAKRSTLPEKQ